MVTTNSEEATLERRYTMKSGIILGEVPYVIKIGENPRVAVRPVREEKRLQRGTQTEFAFCNSIFEIYSLYWEKEANPVYGCVTDYNNWLFVKYDGHAFYRSRLVYKLAMHNTSIFSIAIKLADMYESKD